MKCELIYMCCRCLFEVGGASFCEIKIRHFFHLPFCCSKSKEKTLQYAGEEGRGGHLVDLKISLMHLIKEK